MQNMKFVLINFFRVSEGKKNIIIFLSLQEKIRALSLKHEADKRELQETLQLEQKALMDNYKRQINAKFKEAEIKIKEQCDRERNQQMELAISEIEKETNAVKISIQNMCDNKIRQVIYLIVSRLIIKS